MDNKESLKNRTMKAGYSYLVQTTGGNVYKIEVLEVTETSYKLRYESGNCSWMTKQDFGFGYRVIEHLEPHYFLN